MSFRLLDGDPPDDSVRRLTFVPFLPDGCCIALPGGSGSLSLPHGAVEQGESWLLDAALRIPLTTAGFRMQRVRPFAADDDHVFAWLDGDRYTGGRDHVDADWVVDSPEGISQRFHRAGDPATARIVDEAARSFRGQSDSSYYADNLRLLEPAYLRGQSAESGSGFGGTPAQWRARRQMILDGIDSDGTFLDVGCANGLLMESVHRWAAERGLVVEPYGVDLGPRLVEVARLRLPQWADRVEVGNAIDYVPTSGARFTFVHVLLDTVPTARRHDLLQHALDSLVEPDGRLLVSHYGGPADRPAAGQVARLGFGVAGQSAAADGRASTAWIDVPIPAGSGRTAQRRRSDEETTSSPRVT
ncbi:MAG: hypothetical protein H0U28_00285 [Nocardioidaceae bacterium]|nr:hypothetical protein [Nocardioidaceae bacterium]